MWTFLSFALVLSKNVQIRHSIRLSFNYFNFQRFHRHLKNARSNLASGPFLDLFLSYLPFIETFSRSKLIIFDGYGQMNTHTDGHTWFLESLPHNKPFGQLDHTLLARYGPAGTPYLNGLIGSRSYAIIFPSRDIKQLISISWIKLDVVSRAYHNQFPSVESNQIWNPNVHFMTFLSVFGIQLFFNFLQKPI